MVYKRNFNSCACSFSFPHHNNNHHTTPTEAVENVETQASNHNTINGQSIFIKCGWKFLEISTALFPFQIGKLFSNSILFQFIRNRSMGNA